MALAACSPTRVHERPILQNGDRVASSDAVVEAARQDAGRTSRATASSGTRRPRRPPWPLRAGHLRGDHARRGGDRHDGAQVLAATRTAEGAWQSRDAGDATVMVPASPSWRRRMRGRAGHGPAAQRPRRVVQLQRGAGRAAGVEPRRTQRRRAVPRAGRHAAARGRRLRGARRVRHGAEPLRPGAGAAARRRHDRVPHCNRAGQAAASHRGADPLPAVPAPARDSRRSRPSARRTATWPAPSPMRASASSCSIGRRASTGS
jgi:hypothetical protein